jgi:hypothetical protein
MKPIAVWFSAARISLQKEKKGTCGASGNQFDGAVRETAMASTDGGKTWEPWFDLWFRPHKP